MIIKQFRDVTLLEINEATMLVIASDSAGGVGNKEQDIIKATPEIVGYYTSIVALSEVLAIGATPITIVNNLSVEMNDTGIRIIEGIKRAIEPLNLAKDLLITGSTEENFPMVQTAIGITVIAVIDKLNWKEPATKRKSIAAVVGLPKVGEEVLVDQGRETLSLALMQQLCSKAYIQEILPVGSKGILYEAKEMARTNNLTFALNNETTIDVYKSGGPATCAVVSLDEADYNQLKTELTIPVNIIGMFT